MTTMLRKLVVAAGAVAALGAGTGAIRAATAAETPQVLGSFGQWTAFAQGEGATKICYAASAPSKKEGKYTSRGEAALLVTNNLGDKSFDVVSVVAGYDYQAGADVLAQVDEKKFTMFSKGDRAWNSDSAADKAMVAAMKKGNQFLVVGTSNRGTHTTDGYALLGFNKAYDAINKACPRAEKPAKPAKPAKPGKTDKKK